MLQARYTLRYIPAYGILIFVGKCPQLTFEMFYPYKALEVLIDAHIYSIFKVQMIITGYVLAASSNAW